MEMGGCIADGPMDDRNQAWSIVEQLCVARDVGIFQFLRDEMLNAFIEFCQEEDACCPKRFTEKHQILLSSLDAGISNESGILFPRSALRLVPDLSHISMSDCEKAGNTDDIMAFLAIGTFLATTFYNKNRENKVKVFPDVPFDLKIEHISDHVFPTVMVTPGGKEDKASVILHVNKNFLKMLYALRSLKDRNGDILNFPEKTGPVPLIDDPFLGTCPDFSRIKQKKLGNVYEATLFSLVFFLFGSACRFENGRLKINLDHQHAQKKRGGNGEDRL